MFLLIFTYMCFIVLPLADGELGNRVVNYIIRELQTHRKKKTEFLPQVLLFPDIGDGEYFHAASKPLIFEVFTYLGLSLKLNDTVLRLY